MIIKTIEKIANLDLIYHVHICIETYRVKTCFSNLISFQSQITKWTTQQPLIYYPWESDTTSSSMVHKLVAKPSLMTYARTTDGKIVNYKDMFPNTTVLAHNILTPVQQEHFLTKCYILSMFNPIKPHIKAINCSHEMLKSFICETPVQQKLNSNSSNIENVVKSAILRKCLSGEVISSLYICDGVSDCSDGTDEFNCFCYISGKLTKNNTFCAKECSLSNNCVCPPLYTNSFEMGCTSYKRNNLFRRSNVSNKTMSENLLAKCHDFENNLLLPFPGPDDKLTISRELVNIEMNCSQVHMYECFPGLCRCYSKKERCIYNLTQDLQILMYCRNGNHLQDCENMQCHHMYKCKKSYCIPYRFVCDGKWDCWNGEDESVCTKNRCQNMFRCKSSSVCVHTKNICDNILDCPLSEDELFCDVQNCLPQCTCLNYGIHCYHAHQLDNRHMSIALNGFFYINISHSRFHFDTINYLVNTVILLYINNNISKISFCSSSKLPLKLKYMDLSFNVLTQIPYDKIFCLTHLRELSLVGNQITTIKTLVFRSLLSLLMLDLSHNEIRQLHTCAFCGLENLVLLDLSGNDILQVDRHILNNLDVSLILTSTFHICCGDQSFYSVCTAKPTWPSSCEALLSTWGLRQIGWFMCIAITVFNMVSLF